MKLKSYYLLQIIKKQKRLLRLHRAWRSYTKGLIRRIFHFLRCGHLIQKWRIRCYLSETVELWKLQIGGGYHTKYGWLNGDLIAGDIYLNATKRFPFPNESFDLIFAEQFIEHLSFDEGFCCLQECCRVLKKGGRIRLSTPDLERLSSLYKDENPVVDIKTAMERHRKNHNRTLTTACHFLNDIFRLWGHSFIYDEETLRLQLERAGLSNFSRQKFGCSDNKALGNLERHADSEWMRDAFQLILEAEKT